MFFQSPDEEPNCSKTTSNTLKSSARSRRQKKLRRKNKLKAIRKRQHQIATKPREPVLPVSSVPTIPITMSTWAEDFTKAATWQLKHEVAYWKSKAKALEYENMILHRTIRQNIDKDIGKKLHNKSLEEYQYQCELADLSESEDEQDSDEKAVPESEVSAQDQFEVSEEYIQFLRDNQVYRDFAKQEREKIKAKIDAEKKEMEEMEAGPAEQQEDHQETLKKVYGDSWERISALEMSLKTQFISICDQDKPMYWPILPLKLG